MKRLTAAVLAIALALSLCAPAQGLQRSRIVLHKIFWQQLVVAKRGMPSQYPVWREIFCNTTIVPLVQTAIYSMLDVSTVVSLADINVL